MKISLDALSVLDAIERTGSFAKAAQQLYRVPSAVSYTIRKLEDDLGIAVFDRSGTRPQLTEAGLTLLVEGRHLLQAAHKLEQRTQRIASGWEAELNIALDQIMPTNCLLPFCGRFYEVSQGTHVRLSSEVLGGSWDALYTSRVDLVVGAPGDAPTGGGFATKVLGKVCMVFAVATEHPLAKTEEPITNEEIRKHRAIAIADSSRELQPRTYNIVAGQETFVVPNMDAKLAAQCAGLGIGWLPDYLAAAAIDRGELIVKQVATPMPAAPLHIAWKTGNKGLALQWFVEELSKADIFPELQPS